MTTKPHLIVIGNGMAGCRAVEEILARDAEMFCITIFGAEPRVNYNRIMLSPLLAGEKSFEDIIINGHDWYADNGIELISGDPVATIDRAAQTVGAATGATATSTPARPQRRRRPRSTGATSTLKTVFSEQS